MSISKKDRLFLINQYKILSELKEDEADHYNNMATILENGYERLYYMIDEKVADNMPSEAGQFVLDILTLYGNIECIKRSLKSKAIDGHYLSYFNGFDGNNETEYMEFAIFLIDTQEMFTEQKRYFSQNDHLNSHAPMIETYRRMLEKSKEFNMPNIGEKEVLEIFKSGEW